MSLIDLLLRRQPDPTADWPPCSGKLPEVAIEPFALGRLRLGDHVELARSFGRPEKVRRSKQLGAYWLYYRRWGVELEFEDHKFASVVFLIGDECWAGERDAPRCQPLVAGVRLNDATGIDDVVAGFGPPRQRDDDVENCETVLFYIVGGDSLEFELDEGRLVVLHVHRDE